MDRSALDRVRDEVVACRRCPRLVAWRERVAREKVARFADETYWGRPVPGFGPSDARVLVVGLAPAANGGNRTGRIFTGDRSGDFLYPSLHRAGLANRPTSTRPGDGLELIGAYLTAVNRCAPPQNRPTPAERDACLPYLAAEIAALPDLRAIVALGAYAWNGVLRACSSLGIVVRPKPRFAHGAEAALGPYRLLGTYHPSQRNTFTGTLSPEMLDAVLLRAARVAGRHRGTRRGRAGGIRR